MDACEAPSREAAGVARRFTARYLWAVVGGALSGILSFGLLLSTLHSAGHLPPPQLANDLCTDEKLRFLRNAPELRSAGFAPGVLVVGSSVSLRHFDGEAVERVTDGRVRAFNGGFCGLRINETAFATRFFVERYPSIQEVVTILAPQDLTMCRSSDTRIFDPDDVRRYVYGDAWALPFYLKYFDPFTFVKNAYLIATGEVFRWGSSFDRYGALPYATDERRTQLVYGALDVFDSECLQALRAFAHELKAGGQRLVIATMPIHPAWLDRYDPRRTRMREFDALVSEALAGTGATLWRPRTLTLRPDDYIDAIHIRWSAAKLFSYALAEENGLGQTVLAAGGPRKPVAATIGRAN